MPIKRRPLIQPKGGTPYTQPLKRLSTPPVRDTGPKPLPKLRKIPSACRARTWALDRPEIRYYAWAVRHLFRGSGSFFRSSPGGCFMWESENIFLAAPAFCLESLVVLPTRNMAVFGRGTEPTCSATRPQRSSRTTRAFRHSAPHSATPLYIAIVSKPDRFVELQC